MNFKNKKYEFLKHRSNYSDEFVVVRVIDEHDNEYESYHTEREEFNLVEFVMKIRDKLTDSELNELSNLIDDYGSRRYRDGYDDAETQANYY